MSKRRNHLKTLRKGAHKYAHQLFKEVLPQEEIQKLKGHEELPRTYEKINEGGTLRVSKRCYKGIYKKVKEEYYANY